MANLTPAMQRVLATMRAHPDAEIIYDYLGSVFLDVGEDRTKLRISVLDGLRVSGLITFYERKNGTSRYRLTG